MGDINYNVGYSLDDICIIPARISRIESREECDVYYKNFGYFNNGLSSESKSYIKCPTLPIFTAPMPSVVDENTIYTYIKSNITPIVPRTVPFNDRIKLCTLYKVFVAFSLNEMSYFTDNNNIDKLVENSKTCSYKICIDIANGNMIHLITTIEHLKNIYGSNMIIMSGNVANVYTYSELNLVGCDYVRVSIGTGSACTTATNTGIYAPPATLINECSKLKRKAKIVADGGINSYRNIIKALALGADYVMLGGMLSTLNDSAGEVVIDENGVKYKKHFGMASIEGQKALGKDEKSLRAPEGLVLHNKIKDMSINDFSKNVKSYLQTAMSYCGKRRIFDFIHDNDVKLNVMSPLCAAQYNQNSNNVTLNII